MLTAALLALVHAPHPLAAVAGGVLVGVAVVLPLLARAAGERLRA